MNIIVIMKTPLKFQVLLQKLKATIHEATLLLATVVTRLWQPCSRVVTSWLQPGYNQSCPVYGGSIMTHLTWSKTCQYDIASSVCQVPICIVFTVLYGHIL